METFEPLPDCESLTRMFSIEELENFAAFDFDEEKLNALASSSNFYSTEEAMAEVNEASFFNLDPNLIYGFNPTNEACGFSTDNYIPLSNHTSASMDIYKGISDAFVPVYPYTTAEEAAYMNNIIACHSDAVPPGMELPQLESKFHVRKSQKRGRNNTDALEGTKKKLRVSKDVEENKRNTNTSKKSNNEDSNDGSDVKTSSSYSSDDENASQETTDVAPVSLNAKTRASRGTATDPQSLYARKRREKINERLKTLQNLVPNGTKVDISTMLEEAVSYVKFLQLQIKLLSSDDMWMYAPLAYNGMGLHQQIFAQFL